MAGAKQENFYFQVWSGIFPHREKMGAAFWEFCWCILRVTEEIRLAADRPENERWGLIFGGQPVPLSRIAEETFTSLATTERHFRVLRAGGYIVTKSRGNKGLQIGLAKSKKWPRKTPEFLPFHTIQEVFNDRFGKKSKVPKMA